MLLKKMLLALTALLPLAAAAAEYTDPETNVVYTYDPNGTTAIVRRGRTIDFDCEEYMQIYLPGSKVSGDIEILSHFTVDGKEYTVTKIGYSAFAGTMLTSVTIPQTVTEIEFDAFIHCLTLTTVNIQEGLKKIGTNAFESCEALTSLTLPESVTEIVSSAFFASGLVSFTIPSGIEKIGASALRTPSLTSVTSLIEKPFAIGAICDFDQPITLYVPAGTKEAYESTPGWNQFSSIMEIGSTTAIAPPAADKDQASDGTVYSLGGQRITGTPTRGIYLKGGKKYIAR